MGRSSMGGGGGGAAGRGPLLVGGRSGFFRTIGRAATGAATGAGSASRTFTSPPSPTRNTKTNPSTSAEKSNPSRVLSLSLDPPSPCYGLPMYPYFSSYSVYDEDYEWVSGDASSEDSRSYGSLDDSVLCHAPSLDEVQNAVSALKQVSPVGSELDWMEPSLTYNPRMLQRSGSGSGSDRVYDAFHLLQNDPSVQRMVISLSSDKAVWDAVLRNEVVQEIKQAFHSGGANGLPSSDENSNNYYNPATEIVKWIFNSTKSKVCDIIEKLTRLVYQLFPPSENDNTSESSNDFNRLLNNAYMLCVVVLLVVMVVRTSKSPRM